MAWSFNPFTGNLDLTGSSGAVVFEGEVETFADLPETVGDPPVGSSYLVRTSTGVWLVNKRQSGIWIRRNNTGVRATDWEYGGDYPVTSVNGQTGAVTVAVPSASSTTPAALGTAAVGSASTFARADHVHAMPTAADVGAAVLGHTHTAYSEIAQAVQEDSAQVIIDLGLGSAATANLNAISDADLRIVGSTDATKKVALEVDTNVPSGQTVTLTAPSSGGTIARTSDIPSTFAASAITSGTLDIARIPTGTGSTQVAIGNHTHTPSEVGLGNVSNTAQVTSVSGTAPIVSSGGTTPTISVTTGSTAGTVAAGDDSRITGAAQKSANLSDLASASTARTNLGVAIGTDVAAASHSHGNLTSSGAIGSTAGLPVVTTTSGAVTTLALGTANQVLKVNSGGTAVEFGAAGGVTSGSVDNAVLRADGTGGSTSQSSALVLSDFSNSTQETVAMSASVSGFAVTANATTDVFTAVGHNFIANQQVAFTSLTGGSGVDMTRAYYVRDISGDTFKLSFSRGTGALGISTDITAGTIVSAVGLVFRPQGFGGIMTAIPDGTSANGNARGYDAVDLCNYRTGATQVASGLRSALLGGATNVASGNNAAVVGGNLHNATGNDSFVGAGVQCTASGSNSATLGGNQATASGSGSIAVGGFQNQATAENTFAFGRQALANRLGIMAHGIINFAAIGDAQRIRAVLRCKTTTNAAVEMALDGGTTYLTIPSGKVIYAEIRIVGSKSDGSAVACYTRQYAAKNVAGTSTEVFAPVTIGTDNAAGTSLEVATVDAGDYIRIRPTGVLNETWRWVASVDAVEVAYGT